MALAFHNLPHQEELSKEFLFYFISDTYTEITDDNKVIDKPFTPELFGIKSETPFADLLSQFLDSEVDYEYDDETDGWLFVKNPDGTDYTDSNGEKRTLFNFSNDKDFDYGCSWNIAKLKEVMLAHYSTAYNMLSVYYNFGKL